MAAHCFVTSQDYQQYWQGKTAKADATGHPYDGPDRRVGVIDRRSGGHDRRWEAALGRRDRVLSDRRRAYWRRAQ